MNAIQPPSCDLLLSALDPGSLAAAWAAVSLLGLFATVLAWAMLGRC
jgi:hypothetical protein